MAINTKWHNENPMPKGAVLKQKVQWHTDHNYYSVVFFYLTETDVKTLGEDVEGKVLEARWVTRDEAKTMRLVESAKWLFEWLEK